MAKQFNEICSEQNSELCFHLTFLKTSLTRISIKYYYVFNIHLTRRELLSRTKLFIIPKTLFILKVWRRNF